MPQAVAQVGEIGVAGIGARLQPVCGSVGFDFGPRDFEQGADEHRPQVRRGGRFQGRVAVQGDVRQDMAGRQRAGRCHAPQTAQAAAAQQMEQHRLGLIIALVTHRHALCPYLTRHLQQKGVTDAPCGFLSAQAQAFGQGGHVGATGGTGHTPRFRRRADEVGIRCPRCAAQAMIEGGDVQPDVQPVA